MQGALQETTAHSLGQLDSPSALWLLGSLAGFYRRPFDAALVLQRFAPPFDFPSLIEALEALGLKAGLAEWPQDDWSSLPLPAVVFLPEAEADSQSIGTIPEAAPAEAISTLSPALVVKHGDRTLAWVRPGQTSPEPLSAEVARTQSLPLMLLVAEAEPPVSESVSESSARQQDNHETHKPFGFSWFVPELLRHRSIWRDALLASLAIQLVGLATPLFTQVIIDKVIAHHSESTLIVLGVALVVFMLFTSGMSWLRQYLVLHTGSRIDAVLGEKVLKHLLHLPLPYFEARPTGTLVVRLHGVEQLREFISGAAVSLVLDLPFLLIFLAVMFSYACADC